MKKISCLIISFIVLGICIMGCSSKQEEEESTEPLCVDQGDSLLSLTGVVEEILGENEVLVRVTDSEKTKYATGEKLVISSYEYIDATNSGKRKRLDIGMPENQLQKGDIVSCSYYNEAKSKEGNYYVVRCYGGLSNYEVEKERFNKMTENDSID